MIKKILIVSVVSCLCFQSCNSIKNVTKQVNTSKDIKDNKYWFVSKKIVKKKPPVKLNPEEGGIDFLILNEDYTASYKVGDIVEVMEWMVENNNLILKNKRLGNVVAFKIKSNILIDNYESEWEIAP